MSISSCIISFLCSVCGFIIICICRERIEIKKLKKDLHNEGRTYRRIVSVMGSDKTDKDKISDIEWEIDNPPF